MKSKSPSTFDCLASMRPAQLTPENPLRNRSRVVEPGASMRPAQLTPENVLQDRDDHRNEQGFNEAGAINAGKPPRWLSLTRTIGIASMRPAQLTPENAGMGGRIYGPYTGFNEAGAINAGKL